MPRRKAMTTTAPRRVATFALGMIGVALIVYACAKSTGAAARIFASRSERDFAAWRDTHASPR